MKHSLAEIYSLVSEAGILDPGGFPLRATVAAIAMEESRGNPNAWAQHDPPTSSTAPPSSGLYQVHRSAWPEIYEQTERVRLAPHLSDKEKILGMTELVKPIISYALDAAGDAARTLAARGFRVSPLHLALYIDATWQAGAGHLARWAQRTRTGDPREIVNRERTVRAEVSLRHLAFRALEVAPDIAIILGVLAAFGLIAYAMSQWKT